MTPVEQPVVAVKAERKAAYLAVKTNLLPWCTVVPSVRLGTGETKIEAGSFMPNLALECFFADRWSIAVSGMYSDFSYKNKGTRPLVCLFFFPSNPVCGHCVRVSLYGLIPDCSASTAILTYGAVRSIRIRIFSMVGPVVSGRQVPVLVV